MNVLTNNESGNYYRPPSIVQKQFVGGLVDKMYTLYPAVVKFVERDQMQHMLRMDHEENQERILEHVIHVCFVYELPIDKLLE